ncbi:hypothetical protein [uncultured Cetobacterium sp.]|uniref:FomA family porin-like outer membrane protein n=1 Tax=uncultured Cetobacterium sp. TaxID=527638 RepID=UPI00262C667F|nr:hypothetical protein [uncultured Cetobacterium sp.]
MKKKIKLVSLLIAILNISYSLSFSAEGKVGKSIKTEYEKDYTKSSLTVIQTFSGDSGKYDTKSSHSFALLDYNFNKNWSLLLQWERFLNLYDYKGQENQINNDFHVPKIAINYQEEQIGESKIVLNTQWGARQFDYFKSSQNQIWSWVNVGFDFKNYFPKFESLEVIKFSLMPMFIHGWYTDKKDNDLGYMNHVSLNLLSQYKLPKDFYLQLDFFLSKEFYDGNYRLSNTDGTTYDSATYLGFYAWLEYSKEVYKFNKQLNLSFNFATGFDPFVVSDRDAKGWVPPYWMLSNTYEWPTPVATNSGDYNEMWALFALPELELNYSFNEDLNMSLFAGGKYSNKTWGGKGKEFKFQPQVGFTINYNF